MKLDLDKQYLKFSLYVFLTGLIISGTYFFVSNIHYLIRCTIRFIETFFSVIAPLNIAIVLAYILNKPMKVLEKLYSKIRIKNKTISFKTNRMISIVTIYATIIWVFILIWNFLFPQLKNNLSDLISSLPNYTKIAGGYLKTFYKKAQILKILNANMDVNNLSKYLTKVFEKFSNMSTSTFSLVLSNVTSITLSIFNIVLAIIISFYILKDKEKLKSLYRVFKDLFLSPRAKKRCEIIVSEIDNTLGRFMLGLIIESIIVGSVATIVLLALKYDYAVLIGIIITIFNVIPYFGAFMAMIATFLLGLLQGPNMAITALICIIIIHEIDANIIQPKIIGDKVGVEPIWVMVGITIGGSYFGILGMILAVPVVALLKDLIKYLVSIRREQVSGKSSDIE